MRKPKLVEVRTNHPAKIVAALQIEASKLGISLSNLASILIAQRVSHTSNGLKLLPT